MNEKHFFEELALQEPKKVFVNMVLIPNIRTCQEAIFGHRVLDAIRPMRGLISCLDEKAKQDLHTQLGKLQSFEFNVKSVFRMDVEQLFSEVLSYLHENYLKEFGIRALNPKPKHIGGQE